VEDDSKLSSRAPEKLNKNTIFMGFKTVKQRYRIGHSVCVTEKGICIGSPYIHDLIVIGLDGALKKRHEREGSNDDLDRYMREFDADPAALRAAVEATDTFTKSLPVYTWEGAEIIESKCEKYGWPNATHEGRMMHDNVFFKTRAEAIKAAKEDAACGVKWRRGAVEEAEQKLDEQKAELARCEADLAKLNAAHP
jgi:hypothetical protein